METFKNSREASLEMMDLTKDSNVFTYALKLMKSLKAETITSDQYSRICHDLERYCKDEGISTACREIGLDLF